MATFLPANVHISHHPCLQAKLSQLRSARTDARATEALVHEIALIVGCEALGHSLHAVASGDVDQSPLGYEYATQTISPARVALVPVLRSGLGMVSAIQTLLPRPVPVHHLGLFREPTTLQPVEYYNNLPYHHPEPGVPTVQSTPGALAAQGQHTAGSTVNSAAADLAILIDPVIATGGTSAAAIQTLREWGVRRVLLIAVLASREGVARAADEWAEGVDVWVGGVDDACDERGMIRPGLGDVGDRLFLTMGK
ncbi:MAG: hypothetical protein M1838_001457 [Thelocarpon superellum]|nr:MAG: hypothetical protein M1838_001457 [Thelocarpon superellum]